MVPDICSNCVGRVFLLDVTDHTNVACTDFLTVPEKDPSSNIDNLLGPPTTCRNADLSLPKEWPGTASHPALVSYVAEHESLGSDKLETSGLQGATRIKPRSRLYSVHALKTVLSTVQLQCNTVQLSTVLCLSCLTNPV